MRTKIGRGDSKEWDSTILFHLLLFSSRCSLVQQVPSGQGGGLTPGSKTVQGSVSNVNFVKKGSTVLFDLGNSFFQAEVDSIMQNDFSISSSFRGRAVKNAPIYVCSPEWMLLKELSRLRNKFAHAPSCLTKSEDLDNFVEELTLIYQQLNVLQRTIDEMRSMSKGSAIFCCLVKFLPLNEHTSTHILFTCTILCQGRVVYMCRG